LGDAKGNPRGVRREKICCENGQVVVGFCDGEWRKSASAKSPKRRDLEGNDNGTHNRIRRNPKFTQTSVPPRKSFKMIYFPGWFVGEERNG